MNVVVQLFGAFRDLQSQAQVNLELPATARVADVRRALAEHAQARWPDVPPGLLSRSAFASESAVLRDEDAVPADGRMAVLPPVSGG
jgi:molybdopterin synthase sulfur carrier subunit